MTEYIHRMVSLELSDFDSVHQVTRERGMVGKGFSKALRTIIREWQSCRERAEVEQDHVQEGESD